jgi:acetoin utilization deacetylase AcuC-like enzyme/GNAT superfamily N-acetyltransferase
MFRIRRVFDDILPANRRAIDRVKRILAVQFPLISRLKIERIPDLLKNPARYRFRSILYVAEDHRGAVKGFALLSYDPELQFGYLDYLATATKTIGRGIGGALYERVREEAFSLGAKGIFFECLPDDPRLSRNPAILRNNRARLRFYEEYGARPIVGTAYETPVKPGQDNPPYLVFDDLGQGIRLPRDYARVVVVSILERKYKGVCTPEYVRMVVESFRDDPVRLREPRYAKRRSEALVSVSDHPSRIALVVTDRHEIHHVRDRGYVEAPVRIRTILTALYKTDLFNRIEPGEFGEKYLLTVHDADYVSYFKRVCRGLEPGDSVYPYVFPIRNVARAPYELAVRAGYYCIDTFTPINGNAFVAAKRAVDCAMTGAMQLLAGTNLVYVLVRPPGHHAEHRSFGGFCYFNNAAIAAEHLSHYGKVAMLDIDYHHGNGQQVIFYGRGDVLTVSIHGRPAIAYPYFSGFADERGRGRGLGCNVNYPLAEHVDGTQYVRALDRALADVMRFAPRYLVVCLGLDTAKGDPTGTWSLRSGDFTEVGRRIGSLRYPTLVIQEGGYDNRVIGSNARQFFVGLSNGWLAAGAARSLGA